MTEPTRAPSAPTTIAFCAWCQDFVRGARLVRLMPDEGSAFGHPGLFACDPHQAEHQLVPVADQ